MPLTVYCASRVRVGLDLCHQDNLGGLVAKRERESANSHCGKSEVCFKLAKLLVGPFEFRRFRKFHFQDLKELTDEETEKKKVHGKMMSTLQKEQKDLQSFLVEQKTNAGNSVKELSDKKTLRDETTAQLKADESLLTETEDTCKEKSYQFGERKKLRDQESFWQWGPCVTAALEVLTSDEAQATFKSAASFVQLTAVRDMEPSEVQGAYHALQQTASQYHSLSLAKLAVQLKTSGSAFRKVLKQIDTQIEFLKAEGEEDVKHKARCLKQMEDSDSAIATLEDTISKAGTKIERMEGRQAEMEDALKTLQGLCETKKDIVDRQEARDKERKDHLEALKHDQDALVLLDTAMEQIGKFFKENKNLGRIFAATGGVWAIDTGAALIQRHQAEPEKYKDMPDAGFKDTDADYQGAKGSTKGLMGMMESIKGDMEALYEKDYGALQDAELLDTQKEQELTSTKALADLKSDTETKKEPPRKFPWEHPNFPCENRELGNLFFTRACKFLFEENLNTDCAWVKTNFDSRREKRQAEIQGLVEAKGVLQAVSRSNRRHKKRRGEGKNRERRRRGGPRDEETAPPGSGSMVPMDMEAPRESRSRVHGTCYKPRGRGPQRDGWHFITGRCSGVCSDTACDFRPYGPVDEGVDVKVSSKFLTRNDYCQTFIDTGLRPQNFIRDLDYQNRYSEYPKIQRLIKLKDDILAKRASPGMSLKCDLKRLAMRQTVTVNGGQSGDLSTWTMEELKALKVGEVADHQSFVFLWCGETHLEHARELFKKWGFRRIEELPGNRLAM
eukprot:s449_g15.t1